MVTLPEKKVQVWVTVREKRLLDIIAGIDYGCLEKVTIKAHEPVRVEKVKDTIEL